MTCSLEDGSFTTRLILRAGFPPRFTFVPDPADYFSVTGRRLQRGKASGKKVIFA